MDGPVQSGRALDFNVDRMAVGLAIMGLGVILTIGQISSFWMASRLWPVLLIAVGVGKLFSPVPTGPGAWKYRTDAPASNRVISRGFQVRRGGWLIVIGTWLLLDQLRIVRAADSWPLLLVAAGGSMVWRAIDSRKSEV